MIDRRTLLHMASLGLVVPLAGQAQDKYPSKSITWVCPYAAGGNADNRSRQVAKVMSALLGQSIVIDNKAGAGGKVFIYERHLLASNLLPSSFERAAQDCI